MLTGDVERAGPQLDFPPENSVPDATPVCVGGLALLRSPCSGVLWIPSPAAPPVRRGHRSISRPFSGVSCEGAALLAAALPRGPRLGGPSPCGQGAGEPPSHPHIRLRSLAKPRPRRPISRSCDPAPPPLTCPPLVTGPAVRVEDPAQPHPLALPPPLCLVTHYPLSPEPGLRTCCSPALSFYTDQKTDQKPHFSFKTAQPPTLDSKPHCAFPPPGRACHPREAPGTDPVSRASALGCQIPAWDTGSSQWPRELKTPRRTRMPPRIAGSLPEAAPAQDTEPTNPEGPSQRSTRSGQGRPGTPASFSTKSSVAPGPAYPEAGNASRKQCRRPRW